ncbi:MAG: aminotransferase class I/II-fold pyridoxal phosphate-dependent enzyme [Ginsengibacter sp.]
MQTAKRLEGVGEYYFSQKLREIEAMNNAGKNVINLGIGSPDMPPHPDVIKVLYEEALKPGQHAYQNYKGNIVLRTAIAQWYKKCYDVNLNPDTEILPLIGSKEGIMHICMTYINEGTLVLIPNPGYPTYKSAATIAGANVQKYSLTEKNDWFPDFIELEEIINTANSLPQEGRFRGSLMFVNYPHMPTGQLPTLDLFVQLVAFAKKHNILICHDNPYSFILNDSPMSILAVDGAMDVVIELNSLSKSHNMAGWRVGIMAGAKERIDDVIRFKSNMDSGMFLPLQLAAAKALELGKDWFDEINLVYRKRKKRVLELLDILKCNYHKNQGGMFVWARIPLLWDNAYDLCDKILEQSNVFITPGGIFGSEGDKYVRVSLCSTEEKIEEAIKRISFQEVKK